MSFVIQSQQTQTLPMNQWFIVLSVSVVIGSLSCLQLLLLARVIPLVLNSRHSNKNRCSDPFITISQQIVSSPVLTASLASCTAIFDKPDIFSAVLMASMTNSSAGNTLLTRPASQERKSNS